MSHIINENLPNYSKVACIRVSDIIVDINHELGGWDLICVICILISYGEHERAHFIKDVFTSFVEETPVPMGAEEVTCWEQTVNIIFELLKMVLWHTDEGIGRVDQNICRRLKQVIRNEGDLLDWDLPRVSSNCFIVVEFMTLHEQILIDCAESNLRKCLSPVLQESVHSKYFILDNSSLQKCIQNILRPLVILLIALANI